MASRHVETGLIVMCHYFMTCIGVKLEASTFSKKETGSDLSKYEAVISSIRVK